MKAKELKKWIVTVAAMSCILGSAYGAEKPNVILIIGDDISVDDFGCYGNPNIKTPNVDKLAASGLRFTNAYLTTSQCSPTRCSIITGRYPHNTGAPELHMPLPEGQVMFPELLKKAGYYTVAAGKWHLGDYAKNAFDKVVGGGAGGEERWLDCLQNRPKDKPFFMWFASYDAHRPWDDKIQAKRHTPQDVVMPPYMVDIPIERADMARYYDEVQRLDRHTGYVVDELKNQGVLDNTIIIFMADNGRPFWRAKTRLYDSGIKTPLVVHWPAGIKQKGQTCDSLVSAIDIAPTILQLAGLETPNTIQGTNFTPLLADLKASIRNYVFAEHNWHAQIAHERMVCHGDYVYIRNAHAQLPQVIALKSASPNLDELRDMAKAGKLTDAQMDPLLAPRPAEELFNVSHDTYQLKNLAADPGHRKVLEELRRVMDQWQRRTGDTTPSLDQATPDRHDRKTGKRIQKEPGMRPVSGVIPGQTTGAEKINDPGLPEALTSTLPNFVVIFCDDLGYGDVGWLGPVKNRTPHIDAMAEQGACFTDFYCTSGVCSPSRASLMTGCYPLRVGMHKSSKGMFVLIPKDQKGLHPDEITIAEVLKPQGYQTACIGKWHLGDQPEFLPTRQGFDYYFGLPFSNDMGNRPGAAYPLPLMRNEEVIEAPADQASLTQRYTEEAVKFIHANKDNPFLLYLPHTMPHVPLHASEAFKGKSSNGPYGDAVEEIDWSTGKILEALKALGIAQRTLVVFTSDNGATRRGSNAPLSGHKARYFEGSMRMPCVMWWPGTIAAGTKCDKLCTTMDILPTLADFADAQVPGDRIIDGKSIRNLIEGKPGAESPHEAFYYYYMSQLSAVRSDKWKLWLPLNPRLETWMGHPTDKCEAALYDLAWIIHETHSVTCC